jgi:AcrR family transcriptional regulator
MTTSDRPAPRPLRRDAQRNRDAIVGAARQVFCDHGLEAPLEQIARQAGVGIATLYRHFPNRAALLDAVLADTVQAHVEVAEQALAMDDPWEGFASYLEQSGRLQAADRGLNDVMGMRFPRATAVEAAKTRLYELVGQVVDRAQQSGQLRADLTLEDLAFLNWANTRILPAVGAAGAPTPGGGTWACCWTASGPSGRIRSRSRRCHHGRSTGPWSPSAAAPPATPTRLAR